MPLVKGGEFAAGLDSCLAAARDFHSRLKASDFFSPLMQPELDIVVYAINAADTETASERARQIFKNAASQGLHLAMIELPTSMVTECLPEMTGDSDTVTCLRSVLMKPEHANWLDEIFAILERCATELH
jgi:glutamate/tyrosine decarboxylase-like PLP-dependent enzyme